MEAGYWESTEEALMDCVVKVRGAYLERLLKTLSVQDELLEAGFGIAC